VLCRRPLRQACSAECALRRPLRDDAEGRPGCHRECRRRPAIPDACDASSDFEEFGRTDRLTSSRSIGVVARRKRVGAAAKPRPQGSDFSDAKSGGIALATARIAAADSRRVNSGRNELAWSRVILKIDLYKAKNR
jgi:hypothetical protein